MFGLEYSLEFRVKNISNFVSATMTGHGVEILAVGVKVRVYFKCSQNIRWLHFAYWLHFVSMVTFCGG